MLKAAFISVCFAAGLLVVFGADCSKSAFETFIPKLADFSSNWEKITAVAADNFETIFEKCDNRKVNYYHRNRDATEFAWFEAVKLKCFPGARPKWWQDEDLEEQCSGINHVLGCLPKKIENYHKQVDLFSAFPKFDSKAFNQPACNFFVEIKELAENKTKFWEAIPKSCKSLVMENSFC